MLSDKIKIVMAGLEENWEIEDIGHRSRMISKALSASDVIDKILIIYNPVSLLRRFRLKGIGDLSGQYEIIRKKKLITIYRVTEKVSLISITSLIPESNNIFYRLERIIIAKRLKKIIAQSGVEYDILWIPNPNFIDIASRLIRRFTIFDAIDNPLALRLKKNVKEKIEKSYEWVINNANVIFIASEKQRKIFSPNKNVKFLSNGVDEVFYSSDKNKSVPPEFINVAHPIVGYCGAIQSRLDADLIFETATKLQNYNFVFVGPVLSHDAIAVLTGLKNVHFFGLKKFHQIPSYISQFDVAVIPHKIDDFTDSMNPLKIYEYLACGKPVIATPVNGTIQFKDQLYIAKNSKELINSIKIAIKENSEKKSAMRKKAVKNFSWDLIMKDCLDEIKGE